MNRFAMRTFRKLAYLFLAGILAASVGLALLPWASRETVVMVDFIPFILFVAPCLRSN